ncbi:uracil phosphoribosyltransferase-domain-containing protein [Apiosordaria backusii]|uniref:uracil phosphoribosyltransferase n=1 Tax=Apiosordaria backusii TaxID=314023 RepID=A0AA40ECX9_9PEZI|nr:uracil phosphoribosyltransferase-domain-containing protein [Apiosordaria backusii]
MSTNLPPNVHLSTHPCLLAKLSQLRSSSASARDVKTLINEITLILGTEALASALTSSPGPTDSTPLGFSYTTTTLTPSTISLVPILRSGLSMVDPLSSLLPTPPPIHHLGLFREPSTLLPVEYYNNLPNHLSSSTTESTPDLTIVLDPVIATGGTCAAAIQTLKEWGTKRILVVSILGAESGVKLAAAEWPEGTEIWLAGLDTELTERGMLKPGMGDVGDRLFLTIGK